MNIATLTFQSSVPGAYINIHRCIESQKQVK